MNQIGQTDPFIGVPLGTHDNPPSVLTALTAPGPALPALHDGSVAAQALYHLWHGAPAVVVSAPAGAGKTHMIATLAAHLAVRARLSVAVATPTRQRAFDLANRLAGDGLAVNVLPSSRDIVGKGSSFYYRRPAGLARAVTFKPAVQANPHDVTVATTSQWKRCGRRFDVFLVDDARQCTWARLRELAGVGDQFLLLDDPALPAPTVGVDTSRWDGDIDAPHHPAPEVVTALRPDSVVRIQAVTTHRCGPETSQVLSMLHPEQVTSLRPDTHLEVDGHRQPELTRRLVPATRPHDPLLHAAAAATAHQLASGAVHRDGQEPRLIEPERVAVAVVDHTDVIGVRAYLPEDTSIVVETLERLHGREFDAVILLDPMAGHSTSTYMQADTDASRLYLGLSRHTAACVVISTPDVEHVLTSQRTAPNVLGAQVRAAIPTEET